MNTRHKGIALVWVVILLLVLIGIVGLSLDYGAIAVNAHQLQNAADAGALAGARTVKFDERATRDWAIKIAHENLSDKLPVSIDRNESNADTGELVLGRWVRQKQRFYPTLSGANAVAVVGRRFGQRPDAPELPMLFGQAFSMNSLKAFRGAIAMSIGSTGAGIICLARDPDWDPSMGEAGLYLDSSKIDLRGPDGMIGDIQINADSTQPPKYAFNINGDTDIWAGEINVVGMADPKENWEPLYGDPALPFNVNSGQPRIEDPLASLNRTPPNIATMTQYPSPTPSANETVWIEPGWYPGGLDPNGGTIRMQPGMYAAGGGTNRSQLTGISFNGGALIGDGVTVYVTGDPANGTLYGEVNIGANAYVQLVSPGDDNPAFGVDGLNGVVLWQDIKNHNEARIIGSSNSPIQGTLYFPECLLHLGGGTSQLGNQVLAGALRVHGTVTLGVAYDGRNMIRAYRALLVQ